MRAIALSALMFAAALLDAPPVRSQEPFDTQIARDLVHSDLPLFDGDANMWPRPFYSDDSFGCVSRVAFGDWALRESGSENDEDAEWYSIQNYGTFHCFALVGKASLREDLEGSEVSPAFFVFLGTTQVANAEMELWTLQIGTRPGSDYVLLARAPAEGAIRAFSVLQTRCPEASIRDAGALEILLTRYCAINTRAGLTRLARRMAHLPPLGTLSVVQDTEQQSEASD